MISKLLLVYTGELVFIDSLLYIDFSLLNVIICTYCDQILLQSSTFSNFSNKIQISQIIQLSQIFVK